MSLFGFEEKKRLESYEKVVGRDKRIDAQFKDAEQIRKITKQRDFLFVVSLVLFVILVLSYYK